MRRRTFIKAAGLGAAAMASGVNASRVRAAPPIKKTQETIILPEGNAPPALSQPHFPSRRHAFIWRNWPLVPAERLALVLGTSQKNVENLAFAMGLRRQPRITREQQRRSYLTVIRRNWHLLPYDQLLVLLDWRADQLAYTLREDDFLFIKLGSHKPKCQPLQYAAPDAAARVREEQLARIVRENFPDGVQSTEPLFSFVEDLSARRWFQSAPKSGGPLRLCYSYFALYGDPLLDPDLDPYPDGYLARLAERGVNAVWLQGVLSKLAPFPWQSNLSARFEERLKNLRRMAVRARKHGLVVYLYLNEPRAMPLEFFTAHPELKGVVEGNHAALCTGTPEVAEWMRDSVELICRSVPELGGFFTITASENLTNCWSHGGGASCPRCGKKEPAEIIAGVNTTIVEGIQRASNGQVKTRSLRGPHPAEKSPPQMIAWDWGWNDAWAEAIINQLPKECALMSVSEWSLPIERGGVKSTVGEYSISSIGPGPRAKRHWELARRHGLRVIAKIQASNSWELSSVPYIPALENVAAHAAHLRQAGIADVMLGWTLGGYPSPNIEIVSTLLGQPSLSADEALRTVARRRFGSTGETVLRAWHEFSAAFCEFPYHIGVVYAGPQQLGPANLLWEKPTRYAATMVGFPYDDLKSWRAIYSPEVFAAQMEKVADGFKAGVKILRGAQSGKLRNDKALGSELRMAEAAEIHFRSVANQVRFVMAREALAKAGDAVQAGVQFSIMESLLHSEIAQARALHQLQRADSRLGFEASNQYYYVPAELVEKVLNCRDLLDRWLPAERDRWQAAGK